MSKMLRSKRIQKSEGRRKRKWIKPTREHLEYLTDQITLRHSVGFSLQTRAELFNKRFPPHELHGDQLR